MKAPGFAGPLKQELQAVSSEIQKRVHRVGALTDEELVSMTTRFDADPAAYHPEQVNIAQVDDFSFITDDDVREGEKAIADGKVAFCVLAGGAGTRMGEPKALVRIPGIGLTMLAWKIMQGGGMPTWIMTAAGSLDAINAHIQTLVVPPGTTGTCFEQFEGYRLTPANQLARTASGEPDLYPLGHGDVGPALIEGGVLDSNPSVEHVIVCNVDNVLASPHAGLVGYHIRMERNLTCELVPRQKGDKGGTLAWVNGRIQVAEDFRLPDGFAAESPFMNTNTMIISTETLSWPIPWRWHRVRKQLGTKLVIQHERLLQQYTEECSCNFIVVPRDARYLGVKTPSDLEVAGKVLETFRFK